MAKTKLKLIHYTRAQFFLQEFSTAELQTELNAAMDKFGTVAKRSIVLKNGVTVESRFFRKRSRGTGSLLHVVAFVAGESATIVKRPSPRAKSAPLGAMRPPAKSDFMDSEAYVLISGNNALVCSHRLSDKVLSGYLNGLIQKSRGIDKSPGVTLNKVADIDRVKLIQAHGVKRVVLNASLYEASIANIKRTTPRQKLLGRIWDEFKTMIAKDTNLDEATYKSELSAQVVISTDGRSTHEVGGQALEHLALAGLEAGADGNESGITIVTGNDVVLSADHVSMGRQSAIATKAKNLVKESAIEALDDYFTQLKSNKYLEL